MIRLRNPCKLKKFFALKKNGHPLNLVLLTTMTFCLTGCVFIRLSRVLVQMKHPEHYLFVDLKKIPFDAVLVDPIVKLSDLEWLLGKKGQFFDDGAVSFEFKKTGPQDRHPWSLLLWTDAKSRIRRFQTPERLSVVMGNEFLMRSIEAIGKAEVSIRERRVYMVVTHEVQWQQILELMGLPMKRDRGRWRYRFGEEKESFSVTIEGGAMVNRVFMEANHYGIDVDVVPASTGGDSLKK
jgi:hypothetical protein